MATSQNTAAGSLVMAAEAHAGFVPSEALAPRTGGLASKALCHLACSVTPSVPDIGTRRRDVAGLPVSEDDNSARCGICRLPALKPDKVFTVVWLVCSRVCAGSRRDLRSKRGGCSFDSARVGGKHVSPPKVSSTAPVTRRLLARLITAARNSPAPKPRKKPRVAP
eukprot:CAMPEP_0182542740 /NCGR_PEP_ID=MMETSP1323-20130603/30597_1 /TAXON_ID=236787 /ORGANISM="Florenciella parvula, Strain RCC1693" /LENGTH=165 /DNA_ID=CAMNT_0024753613 /DNA_START=284 /DNA_END=778 /DNA_ORIENTATION=+